MKAQVKSTGKIVEVDYIEGDYLHTSDGLYLIAELEGIESDIDYWTRLEHQYAGMAMQGIMMNEQLQKELNHALGKNEFLEDIISELATDIAHALVEKYKEKEERK